MADHSSGAVVSVNVGVVRDVIYKGKPRTTAIFKEPVAGPVRLVASGAEGDHQADPTVHGGPRKAVYAYAAEDAAWWAEQLGQPIPPGCFGENLTLSGLPLNEAVLGERWQVGGAVLEVTQPRFPCWKLGFRMGSARFPKRFLLAERAGTYLRVVQPGSVQAGDDVARLSAPNHPVTIGLIARLNHADRALALALLEAAAAGALPEGLGELLGQAGVA
jgi:MOSC domain-containing protein YiiM